MTIGSDENLPVVIFFSKGNITDAKASVVAATNAQKLADEASEALESARQEYLPLIMAFTQVECY